MKIWLALAGLAIALAATSAFATVSFDSNTGTGKVGQGDIAPAFGWNAAQFQQNAAGVHFVYSSSDNYSAVCGWMAPSGPGEQTQTVTISKTANINITMEYDSRTHKMVTGFILGGFAMTQQSGQTPSLGGMCQGPMAVMGTWKQVTPLSHSGTLSAVYAGMSAPLPF